MKVYKLLLAFEKIGLLKPMCHVGLLPSHLMKWMDTEDARNFCNYCITGWNPLDG